jgi:anthranilate phosphoribosyltransferase
MTLLETPPFDLRAALERLLAGSDLSATEAERALGLLASPATPPALQAAFLVALRAKGESVEELVGCARGMLALARGPIPWRGELLADTCGTGGDGTGSFNLSTAAALVVAALGVPVAKHGNRSVSSRCGSADVLEALGVPFARDPEEAGRELARHGFAFLFAPHFHPAVAAIGPVRRELGVRTVFNLLGPLVNPARPTHQLLGACTAEAAERLAGAAARLGARRVFVVHGHGGFDEATPCGPFVLFECTPGRVERRELDPRDFGLRPCRPEELAGGDARANAERLRALLAGERGPLRDAVCLNAALVLLLVGRASEPRAALRMAGAALDDGRAAVLLTRAVDAGGRP